MARFTPEELAAMAAADREIEEEFRLTREEWDAAKARDRSSRYDNLDEKGRKIAEAQKAYYEANREKIAEAKKAYYEANREKIAEAQKAYREANREKIAEKRRERRNYGKHPAV